MTQLAFDFQEPRRDPLTCPHIIRTAYEVKGGEVAPTVGVSSHLVPPNKANPH